jgi:hypothetical protein
MINNLSTREKILISVFIFILLVSVFFHFYGLPVYWRYVSSGEELRELINERQKKLAGEEITRLELVQLGKAGDSWNTLRKNYTTGIDSGEFLVYIGMLAGIKISINQIGSYPCHRQYGIVIQPYSLEISGDYTNIIELLKKLEEGNYCVNVKKINFHLPEGYAAAGVENINAAGEIISGSGDILKAPGIAGDNVLAGIDLEVYFLPDD